MVAKREYTLVEGPNYHESRRREILAKHPEIRDLYGSYPLSALYITLIVLGQLLVSYFVKDLAWFYILGVAYCIGAFANHSLYVMIHDCCHNVVFKRSTPNKLMGLVCDIALVSPSAMGFRKYHLIHHKHLGEYSYDPDITSYTESKLIGNSAFMKTLWLSLFSISQSLRPLKVQYYKALDFWTILNIFTQIIVNLSIYSFIGPKALLYLALSTLFALGLHPLGGRWIQEHYLPSEDHGNQETYSYYGPLNKLTFNMGYHNEHHDFMHVAWINQPKIKELAPEFYNSLISYNSWTKVLLNFIFNPKMDSFSRIIHPDRHPKARVHDEGILIQTKKEFLGNS